MIILFQPLLSKYLPQPATPPVQTQTPNPISASGRRHAAPGPPFPLQAAKRRLDETETVVENDFYRITFTNRGALVKSWILKKYDDDQGKPLELVSKAAAKFGYPLSLWTYDEGQRNKINSALFVASNSGSLHAPTHVTFEYADQDVAVRKTFSFDDSYVIHVDASVVVKGSPVTAFPDVARRLR